MDNAVITVKNVAKVAGDRQLLADVSFSITSQALVALIGPNGAGKSTLVKIILGLDKHYTGKVVIKPGERVHYIPQVSGLDQQQLPISVHEYLSIGTTALYGGNNANTEFTEALSHIGVSPDVLTQSFSSLSGGEQQRVAIARALMSDPTILVLDEPFASVDYASREGLYQVIRHLQQDHKMTVLLVSHDVESVLPLSDQVLCLNKTLHTDCHPSAYKSGWGDETVGIHHHC